MLEFIPDPVEGWLAVSLGLLAAITAGVIVRLGEFRTALILVTSFIVNGLWNFGRRKLSA
jgi:heme A synthase